MPAEHSEGGLEDLMMGNVSEGVSESDEVFADRVREAQAKVQQVKKDEKKAKNFDTQLAKIIPMLSPFLLDVVILLIDFEVPSLTVLAIISLIENESGKICWTEFHKHIAEKADFTNANLPANIEEKISYWWTFIYGADHISNTLKIKDLKDNTIFLRKFSHYLGEMLVIYLKENKIEDFDKAQLKKILQKYEIGLFDAN